MKKQVAFVIEPELHEKAKDLAWKKRMSFSALVGQLLEEALKEEDSNDES